jgi:hypothetical protein
VASPAAGAAATAAAGAGAGAVVDSDDDEDMSIIHLKGPGDGGKHAKMNVVPPAGAGASGGAASSSATAGAAGSGRGGGAGDATYTAAPAASAAAAHVDAAAAGAAGGAAAPAAAAAAGDRSFDIAGHSPGQFVMARWRGNGRFYHGKIRRNTTGETNQKGLTFWVDFSADGEGDPAIPFIDVAPFYGFRIDDYVDAIRVKADGSRVRERARILMPWYDGTYRVEFTSSGSIRENCPAADIWAIRDIVDAGPGSSAASAASSSAASAGAERSSSAASSSAAASSSSAAASAGAGASSSSAAGARTASVPRFAGGQSVMAQYTDGHYYYGRVKWVDYEHDEIFYGIRFYDDASMSVPQKNIRPYNGWEIGERVRVQTDTGAWYPAVVRVPWESGGYSVERNGLRELYPKDKIKGYTDNSEKISPILGTLRHMIH